MKEFVKLTLAEQAWTFRALDLDQIELLEPQFITVAGLATATDTMPKEGLAAVAEIACESLKFKHPEMTVAQCRKLITIGTMQAVIEAVRGVSSLEVTQGEATAGMV